MAGPLDLLLMVEHLMEWIGTTLGCTQNQHWNDVDIFTK